MQKKFDSVWGGLLTGGGLRSAVAGRASSAGVSGADSVGSAGETRPTMLVGVSGGVDSMSLLELCLHSTVPAKIVAAHCNFHLRGSESDGDEAFVREFCEAAGVELCTADFDTAVYARANGLSIEIAARELRYGWFAKLCAEKGCDAVVVAHNANDNAETLLLNLLRGTGLRGLGGMRPISAVPIPTERETASEPEAAPPAVPALSAVPASATVPEPAADTPPAPTNDGTESRHTKIPLLRPLLTFTRDQIEGYARANGIPWREDSTNKETGCRRNILRNEVFPLLAEINPSFVRTLNREMQYFADADELVETSVPKNLRNDRIDTHELLRHPHWRLFLFHLLRPYNFNSTVINDIADHISGLRARDGKTRIFSSPTHDLYATSEHLLIRSAGQGREPVEFTIFKTGIYKIEGRTIKEVTDEPSTRRDEGRTIIIEIIPRSDLTGLKAPHGTTYLDADKARFPFTIRSWRHGDWFRPLGMNGATKKVSDLFVDLKYDMQDKDSALFLTLPHGERAKADPAEATHIHALLGERIDDSLKVTSSTTKVLRITLS